MTTTNTDIKQQKRDFRKKAKEAIALISDNEKLIRSNFVFSELEKLPEFAEAKTILMFWAMSDEVQTRQAILKFSQTKKIILPIVNGNDLILSVFTSEDDLIAGGYGILEPDKKLAVLPSEIDLAIIPGLAFDKENNRLGRGKGFYDRILEEIKAPKIGICFKEQFFDLVPTQEFDKKIDTVIKA